MGSERNSLLLQLVHVLSVDAQLFELVQLCALYLLNLDSLVLDVLSDPATFFQVVESILLFVLLIVRDLGSHLMAVIDKSLSLFLFDFLFLGLDLFLLLDLIHVVFSFNSGLLCQT